MGILRGLLLKIIIENKKINRKKNSPTTFNKLFILLDGKISFLK
jgi:hypothetical protein